MNDDEVEALWEEGFNSGYRRALEFVKEEIREGDPHKDIDLFLAWLVQGMIEDWSNS